MVLPIVSNVARMERSAIRGDLYYRKQYPDYTAFHPGYTLINENVARMERSAIRGDHYYRKQYPDYTRFHPGYEHLWIRG